MSTPKPLHIFKPGRHTAMGGLVVEFSESQLGASAAAYDPAKWRAPLVVGHPKINGPAYGWVDGLAASAIGLEAEPADVEPAFADMVNAKRFANISASFWSPTAPGNPVPGVYYLRHVGFLGATPPAIKGLRTPEFAEADTGIVEFSSEWDDVDNAGLWRRMREWILGKFGADEADQVVPGHLVSSLEQSAQQELAESLAEEADAPDAAPTAGMPAFAAPTQEPSVTPEEKVRLEAENAALRQQLAAQHADTRHAATLSFAEGLVAAGRLPPAQLGLVVAALDYVEAADQVVEFGEGDAKAPLAAGLRQFFEALPVAPEFAEEQATKDRAAGASGVVSFAAPRGYHVDGDSAALHAQALAYQKANPNTDYVAAVAAVSNA